MSDSLKDKYGTPYNTPSGQKATYPMQVETNTFGQKGTGYWNGSYVERK